jgi:hypothetical protein
MSCDTVDVGIGVEVQSGAYGCDKCGYVEPIGLDVSIFSTEEKGEQDED